MMFRVKRWESGNSEMQVSLNIGSFIVWNWWYKPWIGLAKNYYFIYFLVSKDGQLPKKRVEFFNMSPILLFISFSMLIPSSQKLEQQASYLRGWWQLFMGGLFMHWAQLGWITTSWGGVALTATSIYQLKHNSGHPSWSTHAGKIQTSSFCVAFIEDKLLAGGVVSQHNTMISCTQVQGLDRHQTRHCQFTWKKHNSSKRQHKLELHEKQQILWNTSFRG